MIVNPDTVEAQVEGSVVYALSAALKQTIAIEGGRVVQSNFHDFPMLRINEMPRVEVHIVKSNEAPSGSGGSGGGQRHLRAHWQTHPPHAHRAGRSGVKIKEVMEVLEVQEVMDSAFSTTSMTSTTSSTSFRLRVALVAPPMLN